MSPSHEKKSIMSQSEYFVYLTHILGSFKAKATTTAEIMVKPYGAKKKTADLNILSLAKSELKRLGKAYEQHTAPHFGMTSQFSKKSFK